MKTKKKRDCGVYKITNLVTGKVYVGSSVQLKKRRAEHFYYLKRNKHKNAHLQASFNKYGIDTFAWDILEYLSASVSDTRLRRREQYWVDLLQANKRAYGYNLRSTSASNLGILITGKKGAKGETHVSARAYHLIDIITGKEYHGKCVSEFCRQHGLPGGGGYSALLRGRINIWGHRFTLPDRLPHLTKYRFRHRVTNEIIEGYSLSSLCRTHNLNTYAMGKVLANRQIHHHGWVNAGKPQKSNKTDGRKHRADYCLIDITTGEEYRGEDIREFCQQHGIACATGYDELLRGTHKTWLKRFTLPGILPTLKKYRIKHVATGEIIESYSIHRLCQMHALDENTISKIIRGQVKQHRGYVKA